MRAFLSIMAASFGAACAPSSSADEAGHAIDAMNLRLVHAYRESNADLYGALFTDTAVFSWPAIPDVRGRQALTDMARQNWPALREMDLALAVTTRRIAGSHATEFGAFQQSWRRDDTTRNVEYGRYVVTLVRQADGTWLMDRWVGFEDSLRVRRARPR